MSVALFKQFVERRPLNMRWSGPFYLSVKTNRRLNDNIWFKTQQMGVNTISNMMKTTVAGTSLKESHKKFTNHSARKTTVRKLKKANVKRPDIVKVTGHRSVQSLDDYDEDDEEEQQKPIPVITFRFSTSEFLRESNHDQVSGTDQTSSNCQVSFIIGRSKRALEISKRQPSSCKRRAFTIEDDYD